MFITHLSKTGQITIPAQLRGLLKIKPGQELFMNFKEDSLIVTFQRFPGQPSRKMKKGRPTNEVTLTRLLNKAAIKRFQQSLEST